MTLLLRIRFVLVGALLGISGCGTPPEGEVSLAEQYNARLVARAESGPTPEVPPSPGFTAFFKVTAEGNLPSGAFQPTRCTVADDGAVYLSNRRHGYLFRWSPRSGEVDRIEVSVAHGMGQPAGLAWHDGRLHLLDATRNRVVRLEPGSGRTDYVLINAGQSPFAIVGVEGGGYILGGERWETERSMSLLARYGADGRFEGSFLSREIDLADETDHFHAPVLIAPADGHGAWVAEPVNYRLTRVDTAGRAIRSFGEPPQGYLPPVPVPTMSLGVDQLDAWMTSWTPHVFIHAGGGVVLSAFQVRRPAAGYVMNAYSQEGELLQGGLFSEALPLCGRGDRLYAARTSGDRTTLRELRFASTAASERRPR